MDGGWYELLPIGKFECAVGKDNRGESVRNNEKGREGGKEEGGRWKGREIDINEKKQRAAVIDTYLESGILFL